MPPPMNLLLVEDNTADAELLTDMIDEKPGAPVVHRVQDGGEALDFVFQRSSFQDARLPDVIVLDLGLPRISGYEVLEQIKGHPVVKDIPIVVLTTSSSSLDRAQCGDLGAVAFFSKPADLDGYRKLIDHWLDLELITLARC